MKYLHTLLLSSISATVIAAATMSAMADNSDGVALDEVAISIQQALEIALAEVPGSVTQAELENEDGLIVWEITVANSDMQFVELSVDANSGSIVKQELDDD